MAATFGLRRLVHSLVVPALVGALVAAPAVDPPAAFADPSGPAGPTAPEITPGTNGLVVWTQYYFDTNGFITSASLSASNGHSYFHQADPNARAWESEWSPDGSRIAYSAYGAAGTADGIWIVGNPFGSRSTPLQLTYSQYDQDPTWSPDGSQIAFGRSQGDNGIWVTNADGSGVPVQLLRDSQFFGEGLSWSPDGTKIAYSDFSGSPFASPEHIYVVDVDGGTPVDLGIGTAPAWRPDGNKIAFEFPFSASDSDIYWMNPDGTGRQALLPSSINEWAPAWAPDGKKMAFLTPAGINTYDWTTGAQASLATGSGFAYPTWGAFQPTCQGRAATVSGTSGPDTLYGSSGVDVIHGLGGDDTIVGRQRQDIICGGTGSDTVSYAGQTVPATAYLGETSPVAGVSDLIADDVENLIGGFGPDTLVGDQKINLIEGGDGADEITAVGGVDDVIGGRGDDRLVGGDGDDRLIGGGGDDVVIGEEGDDLISGAGGDDVLRGGDGADSLDGGLDSDLMAGGPGIDTAEYGGRTIGVNVTIGGGGDDDGSREDGPEGERDRVRGSVENANGGSGADVLTGNEVANQLKGNLGVDQFRGGDGRDVLRANDGVRDSVIDCGAGTDAEAVRDAIDPAAISCP